MTQSTIVTGQPGTNGRPTAATRMAIRGGTLIDGRGGPPVEKAAVLVEGERVAWAGPATDMPVAPDATVIDATNKTILPGLIDVHSHLMYAMYRSGYEIDAGHSLERATINAALNAGAVLRMGFTTVRDLGSRGGSVFAVRDAVEAGQITGPRILASGRILTTTGGLVDFHPSWTGAQPSLGYLVNGKDEVRKAIRQLVKDGADCIKLEASAHAVTRRGGSWATTMSEEEIRTAVEEAHKYGKRVAAHAQTTEGIKNALRAGVDTLEHGTFMDDEGLDLLLNSKTWLVPTISNIYSYTEEGPKLGWAAHVVEEMAAIERPWVENFRRAMEAGARIAMGTDVGNRYRQQDRAVEMQFLVRNGMDPMRTIVAATQDAATAIGMEANVGSLVPGKYADVVLVDGDPLRDIAVLRERERLTVFKGGKRVAD